MLGPTDDVLTHRCILLICPVCTDLDRTISGTAIADTEVPMFARLRGTVGLPLDNATWWPDGVPRTEFAPPTVDLLERTLRALRALPVAPIAG
ncbi:hypothetical protein EXE59_03505 [Nocardioides eburneiflavus]|uniref:Uncharacterized protein n=1 Tax=Nocardioides eburneiflavus TaxID=2518372 RepID=A0A4Z1C2Q0_9ACTN|nr:hypothetical protein [Nocardioides eburneiflavus]TGN63112.1 hypothetical protein EXE59_03505 [Nocardioides eburneiflavus]